MGEGINTIKKGTRKTDRSYIRDTDKGLNKRESYTVNKLESQIRNRKTEKGYIVGSDGQVVAETAKSAARSAQFRIIDLMRSKDGVMTHNHPTEGANSGLYGTMAGRIGVPLSPQDLRIAVQYDLKEVRAATPTSPYSIRRPKEGWGDRTAIERVLRRMPDESRSAARSYYNGRDNSSYQRRKESADRANVGTQYQQLKSLAKQFGWEFTRRRVK